MFWTRRSRFPCQIFDVAGLFIVSSTVTRASTRGFTNNAKTRTSTKINRFSSQKCFSSRAASQTWPYGQGCFDQCGKILQLLAICHTRSCCPHSPQRLSAGVTRGTPDLAARVQPLPGSLRYVLNKTLKATLQCSTQVFFGRGGGCTEPDGRHKSCLGRLLQRKHISRNCFS